MMDPNDNNITQGTSYVDEYSPPDAGEQTPAAVQPVGGDQSGLPPAATAQTESQALEDQNIFVMLGVNDGTDEQKEAFLDELQQVIWEDFIENDVDLLLTDQEQQDLRQILDKTDIEELQKQEEAVVFLEKLVPDLEEIMLEKALELKEDMVRERVAGLKEYYSDDSEKLNQVHEAEQLANQGKWAAMADKLNSISR